MNSCIKQVVKRDGTVVPFNCERITHAIYRAAVAVGGRNRDIAEELTDEVVGVLERTCGDTKIPTVEEIQDIVEKVLIERGHARTAKAYILYRQDRARRRERRQKGKSQRDPENIPYRKLWEILNWAVDHDVHNVYRLNERIARGGFADIVRESDEAYERDVHDAALKVLDQREQIRVVIVAGPSSSGKTTTTVKLAEHLERGGVDLVSLNVDNYFFDLEMHPKDEYGDYDFETPQALDIDLINKHLAQLVAGEEVWIPYYDFKTGKRQPEAIQMQVDPGAVILIDSLHGLYEDMTQSIPEPQKFKVYIETLLQMKGPDNKYIRFTDLRLMRRMVRDARDRAYDPRQTLEHWHYVRSSELRYIIPYVHTADYVINGATPYELPVLRPRLFAYFAEWVRDYADAPNRMDAFIRAERVHHLLQSVIPVEDDSVIPPTSHIREFIGGSAYELH
jgi:uridine kinase